MTSPRSALDPVEQQAISDVVVTERWARDTAHWDVMREQFHQDSIVDISWIHTDGPDFVHLSEEGFAAGGRSSHVLSPVHVQVRGGRATADTGAIIAGPMQLAGVDVVLTAYSRIVERLEKRGDNWRISELRCVYQFDHFTPALPGAALSLDAQRMAGYRSSYAALSYWVEETRGPEAVRRDLPGIDRPDTVTALYEANDAWLSQGA